MATNLNTIKNWFKTGLKPTQAQFWAWMDSYWHKDETIPTNKIDGLESALNSKASNEQLEGKVDRGGYEGTAQDLADAIENIPEQVEELLSDAGNRTVKLVTDEDPYFLIQSDDNKFLTITTEFDPVLSLGFTANTEFWIKNTSPTPREVTFDTAIEFIGSPLIPTNGLAILKLIEVVDDVEYWSVNHLLANGTPSGGGGELIKITEGGNTGYRLKGFNPDNYGDIGQNAIDLSFSTGASSTRGATGIGATAEGRDTTASGDYSHAKGYESRATGLVSFAKGYDTIAEGESSHAEGQSTRALGNQSHAEGLGNFARATGEHSGGIYGTDYEPLNNGTDRLVNYGNGTSSVKRDAFTIFRNGAVRIFRATLPSITNAMSGMLIFDSGNSNRPTIHNGTEWKALAYLSDLPFANIQTSSFTAVNLVAYSTNGTLTVTDPTPETNKGYIVHVVGGTTTIDGVAYTAGALVYRFYNGTVWSSVDYGASSNVYDFQQLQIFKNTGNTLKTLQTNDVATGFITSDYFVQNCTYLGGDITDIENWSGTILEY